MSILWKKFFQYVINKYLKKYIEQLDDEKLKFSLRTGNLCLENLRIKPEALAYLNIPATVVAGFIEQLKVTIPWKSLGNSPTEVYIDGLYVLVVSKNDVNQNLEEHYSEKMRRVQDKVDNLRKTAFEKGRLEGGESDFLERTRFQVKRNLIFQIRNLHICYERRSATKLGHPFSFGMTLHSLELITPTNVKLHHRIKGNTFLTYQIKEMNSLAFYWNTKCKSRLNMSFQDIVNDLKSQIATTNSLATDPDLNYSLFQFLICSLNKSRENVVLRPTNLSMEFFLTLKPKEHHYQRSTYLFDIDVEQISFHFNAKQISDILDFIKFQKYTTVYDHCREYRDLLYQYSFGSIQLTSEQEERLEYLESKLDVFHLAYIRHKIEMETYYDSPYVDDSNEYQQPIPVEQPPEMQSNPHRHHRISLTKMKNKLSTLSNKVFDQIKTTATTSIFIPNERDFIFEDLPKFDCQLKLREINFHILSSISNSSSMDEIINRIILKKTQLSLQRMSVSSRVECSIDFNSIQILGMAFNQQSSPPLIFQMEETSSPDLHIQFELFPLNQKSDYCLDILVQPIQILYDAPTVNRLVECFQSNGKVAWIPKETSSGQIEENLSYKKLFAMNIHFKGMSFVLPQYGVYQKDFSLIRFSSESLLIKSSLEDDRDELLFKQNLEEKQFYRKYQLELTNLQLQYIQSSRLQIDLLRRIPKVHMDFYKCLSSHHSALANWRIHGNFSIKDLYLSNNLLAKVILHFNSIPLFYSNLSEIIQRINFYFQIFSPKTSYIVDLSIPDCRLQLLMKSQQSIETGFHLSLIKKVNKNSTYSDVSLTLNRIIMSASKQSSQIFYETDQLKLNYSDATEQL